MVPLLESDGLTNSFRAPPLLVVCCCCVVVVMLMAAKLIGAGLATIALAGAAVGVGLIFAALIQETSHELKITGNSIDTV